MRKKYQKLTARLHEYLCQQEPGCRLQVHQSHKDNDKLLKLRIFCFIYITVVYIWTIVEMASIVTNFIYLTLQGYFITWLYFAIVLQDYFICKYYGNQVPVCAKLKHFVELTYQTALCAQIPITLIFWTFLFPILLSQDNVTFDEIFLNTNLHAGPIVCLLLDFYYNSYSFPRRHLWIIVLYGTGYMIINLVYSLTVKIIYKPIDWKSLLSYILILSSYVFVCGTHYVSRYIYLRWKAPKIKNRITEGLIANKKVINQAGQQTDPATQFTQKNQEITLDDNFR